MTQRRVIRSTIEELLHQLHDPQLAQQFARGFDLYFALQEIDQVFLHEGDHPDQLRNGHALGGAAYADGVVTALNIDLRLAQQPFPR